jgi:hypothetical protein
MFFNPFVLRWFYFSVFIHQRFNPPSAIAGYEMGSPHDEGFSQPVSFSGSGS